MFKCGFYEKDITPPLGETIPGYGMLRIADDVLTSLYAKAVAIETGGKCLIMISVEALFLPKIAYEKAVEIIEKNTGILSECVMINATHIHTGGPVVYEETKYKEAFKTPDWEYIKMLGRQIGDCGVLAYQRLKPMTARFNKGELYGVSFIRNYYMKDGTIKTNPGLQNPDIVGSVGEIDPELPVFFFFDEENTPKGAIVNFALHHDCVGGMKYCSDYSGVLAENLKKEFGNEFVTVYINGACGNINHVNVNITQKEYNETVHYKRIGNIMTDFVLKLYESAKDFEIDCVDSKTDVLDITRREISQERIEEAKYLIDIVSLDNIEIDISRTDSLEYKRTYAERILNRALMKKISSVKVQVMRFGKCVVFAVPSEIYTDFGIIMKKGSPSDINIVAELANGEPSCYIPTKTIFESKGNYEGDITSASFEEDTGEKITDLAIKLSKEIML